MHFGKDGKRIDNVPVAAGQAATVAAPGASGGIPAGAAGIEASTPPAGLTLDGILARQVLVDPDQIVKAGEAAWNMINARIDLMEQNLLAKLEAIEAKSLAALVGAVTDVNVPKTIASVSKPTVKTAATKKNT